MVLINTDCKILYSYLFVTRLFYYAIYFFYILVLTTILCDICMMGEQKFGTINVFCCSQELIYNINSLEDSEELRDSEYSMGSYHNVLQWISHKFFYVLSGFLVFIKSSRMINTYSKCIFCRSSNSNEKLNRTRNSQLRCYFHFIKLNQTVQNLFKGILRSVTTWEILGIVMLTLWLKNTMRRGCEKDFKNIFRLLITGKWVVLKERGRIVFAEVNQAMEAESQRLLRAMHCKKTPAQLPAVDMQKLPGSFCCYSKLSPKVIQLSFDAQSLCILHSECSKTSTYANRGSLDDSLAGACCMSTAGICANYFLQKNHSAFINHAYNPGELDYNFNQYCHCSGCFGTNLTPLSQNSLINTENNYIVLNLSYILAQTTFWLPFILKFCDFIHENLLYCTCIYDSSKKSLSTLLFCWEGVADRGWVFLDLKPRLFSLNEAIEHVVTGTTTFSFYQDQKKLSVIHTWLLEQSKNELLKIQVKCLIYSPPQLWSCYASGGISIE
ncbi:hypothetical protein VP01_3260g1 [Puccinia sorghi]|uniref:Uncharacterized protein n=1 Tax=Puccinia sorghi TaxID=27349 RepID=A0A0L6UY17_9BASI|nr:hypothetical protein VP01_3260g1 [Puccinia sorghi]